MDWWDELVLISAGGSGSAVTRAEGLETTTRPDALVPGTWYLVPGPFQLFGLLIVIGARSLVNK